MNQLISLDAIPTPALVTAAGEQASVRFLEFFASNIRNPNTRRAYAHAVGGFLAWCAQAGVMSITVVQPLHVATWIELQTQTLSAPTVKQHLAAIRHLFDWLVVGQVVLARRCRQRLRLQFDPGGYVQRLYNGDRHHA
ncbi:site-specific integrase, partial [Caballeronia sp. M23-90]